MVKRTTLHDAGTGLFVSRRYAGRHPNTTVKVTSGAKPTGAPRNAGTGRFVPQAYAARHPRTTVESK